MSAFEEIREQYPEVTDPIAQPTDFLLDIHGLWKVGGGKLNGKIRHSDRFLDDQLRAKKTPVKSLTPKLNRKVKITASDGRNLTQFFLSNWPDGDGADGEMNYKTLVAQPEIEALAEVVERQLSSSAQQPETPIPPAEGDLPGEPNAALIEALYRDCDAVVTVAPEQIFVSAGPKTELIGFRMLIDLMRRIEAEDGKKRPLIWVLDLGGSDLMELSTRRYYLNVQQLMIRFKALKHFKDFDSEERMSWLRSRGAVVLLDTYGPWRKRVNLSKHPQFSPDHCSLVTTPTEWLPSLSFRTLYGSNLEEERMQQRVFQIFYNASKEWDTAPDQEEDLRYVGYSSFDKSSGGKEGRGLELPTLSSRYTEGFKAVCIAAASALDIKLTSPKAVHSSSEEAKSQLEYLGYRILKIEEFIDNY
jgi:hypothetical protein